MKRLFTELLAVLLIIIPLTGCGPIGEKTMSMSVIYGVTALLSLFLAIGYCSLIKKRDLWFIILFISVFIVNAGYFSLSISSTLGEALLANRISYLGSVFLPFSMLMIILDVTDIRYKKCLPGLLLVIGIVIFFIAASPGYLDIYYKHVTLETVNGVTTLLKEYGPWHCTYLFYLMGYFITMITAIIHSSVRSKARLSIKSVILAVAVFVNICVWLLEQMININFEFLSVSYIITELFLLGLHMIIQENESILNSYTEKIIQSSTNEQIATKDDTLPKEQATFTELLQTEQQKPEFDESTSPIREASIAQHEIFELGLTDLTQTERNIYNCYIEGKTTKEIMAQLNIKENTLKYHNKNIYSKLGVSSRKQLKEIAKNIQLSKK